VDGSILTLNRQMQVIYFFNYFTSHYAIFNVHLIFKVNTFQLFDTQMTAMIQFKNDNIILAAGVSDFDYFPKYFVITVKPCQKEFGHATNNLEVTPP
jgi:hypothetical protein